MCQSPPTQATHTSVGGTPTCSKHTRAGPRAQRQPEVGSSSLCCACPLLQQVQPFQHALIVFGGAEGLEVVRVSVPPEHYSSWHVCLDAFVCHSLACELAGCAFGSAPTKPTHTSHLLARAAALAFIRPGFHPSTPSHFAPSGCGQRRAVGGRGVRSEAPVRPVSFRSLEAAAFAPAPPPPPSPWLWLRLSNVFAFSATEHLPRDRHAPPVVHTNVGSRILNVFLQRRLTRNDNNAWRGNGNTSRWVNTCPGQGSRTIRTEESILISLATLARHLF